MPATTGTANRWGTILAASDAILARLAGLHPRLIDLSLDRIDGLLDRLGRPEKSLPSVVHVAGTNGKGSVVAFLRAIAEAAGLRVHAYTSPHLVRFAERIVLSGREIDEAALSDVLLECERANNGEPITIFEITTAAALLAMARTPADLALIEVGLGGRFDATNLVDPMLTCITPVSIDHRDFLGDTLASIAFEKAGILKAGVPAVIGPQPPEALAVIEARASEVGAPLTLWGRDYDGAATPDGGLRYRDGDATLETPPPSLIGPHQIANAAVAVACARRLGDLTIPDTALRDGVARAVWRGRLQRLDTGSWQSRLPAGWALWIDGGHNPAAAMALAAQAARWADRPLHLVVGMLNSKDAREYFQALAGKAASLHTVAIPGEENALSAETLAEAATAAGIDATPAADPAAAIDAITAGGSTPGRILVCGSLYLAGWMLKENEAVA